MSYSGVMKHSSLFLIMLIVSPLWAVHKGSSNDEENSRYQRKTNCTVDSCEISSSATPLADKQDLLDSDSSCVDFLKANKAINSKPIFLKFTAEWCGPCQVVKKLMTDEYKAKFDVDFMEIDVDLCPHLAQKYNVESIPFGIVFKNGVRVNSSSNGLSLDKIDKLLSSYPAKN